VATQTKKREMTKKVLGIIFIVLAIIMSLAVVGQLSKLFTVIIDFIALFKGNKDASQVGYTIGHLFFWLIQISLTIILWKYGVRWSRKPRTAELK
jgi:Na+/phosphate symporter